MSKTVEIQIEKSSNLVEGLRKHLSGNGTGAYCSLTLSLQYYFLFKAFQLQTIENPFIKTKNSEIIVTLQPL